MATTLSRETEELLETLAKLTYETRHEGPGGEPIKVSSVTRGLGFLYEKIRNALDYHEEHLLTKNALFRILKRRLLEVIRGKKIGRAILEELIRGHYLENNAVPEGWALAIDEVLAKYHEVLLQLEEAHRVEEEESDLRDLQLWFLQLGAAEVEELLHQSHHDRAFISFFYEAMRQRIEIDPEVHVPDLDLQLYLASYRNFLLADEAMEAYTLFRLYFQEWENPRPEFLQELAKDLPGIRARIEKMLSQSIRKDLDRIFKRRSLLVLLLRDLIREDPEAARHTVGDPAKLEKTLRELYDERYKGNRSRLQRSAARAVVFIFATKMLLALLVEIPYELARTQNLNLFTLGLNTFVPPLLLVGAAVAIRMPGETENFLQLVMDFEKMIRGSEEPVIMDILRPKRKRPIFTQLTLAVLYVLNFGLTFYLLWWFFNALRFNWVSAALFLFFLSLVSFFGLRLRKTANELAAVEERENLFRTIFDFLIFPVVEIGRLLSFGLRSINIAAFLFDFLIEAPFQTLVEILEEWFSFLRERKQAL